MKHLSLRIRVFLFFCLVAAGSIGITCLALWIGFSQLSNPEALSAFITAGLIASFGILGLVVFIWLLFDDNVSKPIEAIAASLRVRAHVDISTPIDVTSAQYLGDLAPAASALGTILDRVTRSRSAEKDNHLAALEAQKDQLVRILSDIPIATILVSANHQIVLYDGQAAALMERVRTARLNTSVFDYLDQTSILAALEQMDDTETARRKVTVTARCGKTYTGHIRAFGGGAGYTLMLEALDPSEPRPLTFDFDLLAAPVSATLRDTPLRGVTYVVFDSETTGLDPVKDEVVQLGAVRIVNGKIVHGETFETLVNPEIPIPKRSTAVHGISDEMVSGAPTFGPVCETFHSFAAGSVLVAHNAAFDMAFLHKKAPDTGCAFDHPVLDTVLISAAVFGGSQTHTLDAICDRLGITIPTEQRHTAMGDAVATAQALVGMITILEGRGIRTFGDLQVETNKHRRALKT